jgi:PAS domain S-box-containing protein
MDKRNDTVNDEQGENFISREQTRLLLQNSTIAIAVNLSIAFLTYLAIPSPHYYWLWMIIGASGLRLAFYFWCKGNSNLPGHRIIFLIIIALIILQGATWGFASILLYASAADLHKFYLIAIICGMSGGAILTLSPSFLAFTCFTLPSVLPLVLTLILESDETLKNAGFMGFVFVTAVHLLAKRINISNVEHLRSHRRLELIGRELAQHKDRLEVLVEERTKELKESRENYRRLIEEINDAIFELDSDSTIKYISPVITLILGHKPENLIGTLFADLICPEDLPAAQVLFLENTIGDMKPADYRILDSTGMPHWVRISMRPISKDHNPMSKDHNPMGFRGVLTDIEAEKRADSEKKILLQRFYENQKFEAIGTLAGGIAHDFNNLLMGIQGHASLLSVNLNYSDPNLEHTQAIEEHVRSAAHLTSQLLGTVRGGRYDPKPADLNELMEKSSTMFNRTRKEVMMSRNMSQTPVVAEVDIQQIEQVLLNLYLNSWQAMPEGGEIRLESSRVSLDESFCEPYQAPPGQYARISVADSGTGMDESTRLRVFDPFFTTKGKGRRGTGLGLASAYGIIHNHGGFITIDSTQGQGTTVTLYLPLSDKEPCCWTWTAGEPAKYGDSETILLVDDEDLILNVGKALLENLGYKVIVANGGEQAIEYMKEKGNQVDLVILDMVMPKMDGGITFDQIRELYPSVPVILSSGYSLDGQATKIMQRGCNGFLQKPFGLSELSQKIRKTLDGEDYIPDK